MIVYIVMRSEEHSDYVEKVFFDKERAEKYAAQYADDPDEYARHVEKHKIEDMKIIQNSMTDKNYPLISTTQQPLNIPSNMADIFSMFFLGMLFGWKEPPDLSKFKPKLENAIQGGENAEADIAELAKVLNCPIETLKEAIESIKNETNNINVKP